MSRTAYVTAGTKNVTTGAFEPNNGVTVPKIKGQLAPFPEVTGTRINMNGMYKFDTVPNNFYCFYDGASILEDVLGSVASGGTPIYDPANLDYLKYTGIFYDAISKELKNLANATADQSAVTLIQAMAAFIRVDLANLPAVILRNSGFTMYGNIDMGTKKIVNLPAPSSATEPLRKQDAESGYVRKGTGFNESIYGNITHVNYAPFFLKDPTNLLQGVNWKWVDDRLNTFLAGVTSGDVTAAQQSLNTIIVDPSGTAETNRRFRTIESALAWATSRAAPDYIITIIVEGDGANGAVLPNYNLLTTENIPAYIHFAARTRGVKLLVGETDYYGASVSNKTKMTGFIIDNQNENASTILNYFELMDCTFTNNYSNTHGGLSPGNFLLKFSRTSGNILAENVILGHADSNDVTYDVIQNKIIISNFGISFGETNDPLSDPPPVDVITKNGIVAPLRLNGPITVPSRASATNINLYAGGNLFLITGNTDIERLSVTDFNPYTKITLEFGGTQTLKHDQSTTTISGVDYAGVTLKGGVDITTTTNGGYRHFFLNRLKTRWVEQ